MRPIILLCVLLIPFRLFGQAKGNRPGCQVRKYAVCGIYDTTASSIEVKVLNYKQYLQQGKTVKLGFAKHSKYYPMSNQGACFSWLKSDLVYILVDDKIVCTIPLKGAFRVRGGVRVCIDLWL